MGVENTVQYQLAGANSNDPNSYVVTKEDGTVLEPTVAYTVQSGGYIVFVSAPAADEKIHVREFNHAVNVDRYSDETRIGEITSSVRDPGSNYIALTTIPKLVKKTQYPELYAIIGDKYTLKPEPAAAMGWTATPSKYGESVPGNSADATSNPFPAFTALANVTSPYAFLATTTYSSETNYGPWAAFNYNNTPTTAALLSGWLASGSKGAQQ